MGAAEAPAWLPAAGVICLAGVIILAGPQGLLFDAARGLLTGLALCTGLVSLVLASLPERYR